MVTETITKRKRAAPSSIGAAVREWFRRANADPNGKPFVKFTEIARRSGVSRQLVMRYWKGTIAPGEEVTRLIAQALGVEPPEVFGGAPPARSARAVLLEAQARIAEALELLEAEAPLEEIPVPATVAVDIEGTAKLRDAALRGESRGGPTDAAPDEAAPPPPAPATRDARSTRSGRPGRAR